MDTHVPGFERIIALSSPLKKLLTDTTQKADFTDSAGATHSISYKAHGAQDHSEPSGLSHLLSPRMELTGEDVHISIAQRAIKPISQHDELVATIEQTAQRSLEEAAPELVSLIREQFAASSRLTPHDTDRLIRALALTLARTKTPTQLHLGNDTYTIAHERLQHTHVVSVVGGVLGSGAQSMVRRALEMVVSDHTAMIRRGVSYSPASDGTERLRHEALRELHEALPQEPEAELIYQELMEAFQDMCTDATEQAIEAFFSSSTAAAPQSRMQALSAVDGCIASSLQNADSLRQELREYLDAHGRGVLADVMSYTAQVLPDIATRQAAIQYAAHIGQVLEERSTPHVMRYHRVRAPDSLLGGAMAQMCHGSAKTLIPGDEPWTPERHLERLSVLREIAEAIASIHDTCHNTRPAYCLCDLKTDNVFVEKYASGQAHAVLGDFGGIVEAGAPVPELTSAYAAPGVTVGSPADPRSDLSAMGMMIYELCHGLPEGTLPPHLKSTNEDPMVSMVRYAASQEQGPLGRLVEGLLDVDPEKRPSIDTVISTIDSEKESVMAQMKASIQTSDTQEAESIDPFGDVLHSSGSEEEQHIDESAPGEQDLFGEQLEESSRLDGTPAPQTSEVRTQVEVSAEVHGVGDVEEGQFGGGEFSVRVQARAEISIANEKIVEPDLDPQLKPALQARIDSAQAILDKVQTGSLGKDFGYIEHDGTVGDVMLHSDVMPSKELLYQRLMDSDVPKAVIDHIMKHFPKSVHTKSEYEAAQRAAMARAEIEITAFIKNALAQIALEKHEEKTEDKEHIRSQTHINMAKPPHKQQVTQTETKQRNLGPDLFAAIQEHNIEEHELSDAARKEHMEREREEERLEAQQERIKKQVVKEDIKRTEERREDISSDRKRYEDISQ